MSDITIVIPSCNRSDLLDETLETLIPHVLRHQLPVVIGENCCYSSEIVSTVARIRDRYPSADIQLLDLTDPGTEPRSNHNLHRSVDALYDSVGTEYIFHSEDDWSYSPADFIAVSRTILERFPDIKIVRLTGRDMRPLPDMSRRHTVRSLAGSTMSFFYSNYGGPGGKYGAFTFHPGLRRRSDYLEFYQPYASFRRESDISEYGQKLGHREAILEETFARHIGLQGSALRGPRREGAPVQNSRASRGSSAGHRTSSAATRLVMQVRIANRPLSPLYTLSIERAVLYAGRVGADYHLVTQGIPGYQPHFSILKAYEMNYDKIFYVDCDAIIMDECPDIFESDEFSAAADGGGKTLESYINSLKIQYGIPNDHIYFNTGVVLFTREFLDQTVDKVYEYLPKHALEKPQFDQSLLNEVVSKHYGPYNILSEDWNGWYEPKKAKYIQHYCWGTRRQFDEEAVRRRLRDA